ncbi:hypothetical protein DFH08DRAFT_119007 [Mycena albidolilacea]|uniref:Uncharacterized protein n=1 Tax=Mycena albidolilacea TaxID=1033008 RepID=A0AAD7A742_9AGAR|nr:hypothetical protein DFH08DRAFT_119007 [Mycena albidolilacea]
MIPSNVLFSPPVRVWNLRLLLLETIGVSTFLVITFPFHALDGRESLFYLPWEILFSTFGFILLHHGALYVLASLPSQSLILDFQRSRLARFWPRHH